MIERLKQLFHIEDTKGRLALAGVLLVVGVFLTIAFISFFTSWENDQSVLRDTTTEISAIDPSITELPPSEIQNRAGKIGAIVSKKFIHDWFGIGSFAIVFLCFYCMLRALNFFKETSVYRYLCIAISLMIVSSITFGFFFNDVWDGNIGGCLGYYLSYQLLPNLLGKFVTGLLIVAFDIIYVFCTFNSIHNWVLTKIRNFLSSRKEKEETTEENTPEETPADNIEPVVPQVEQVVNQEISQPEEITKDTPHEEEFTAEIPEVTETENPVETPEDENPTNETEDEHTEEQEPIEESDENEDENKNEDFSDDENSDDNDEEEEDEDEDDETTLDPNDEDEPENDQPKDDEPQDDGTTVADVDTPVGPQQTITPPHIPDGKMQITNTNTAVEDTSHIEMEMQDYDPKADLSHFKQPGTDLLKIYPNDEQAVEVDYDEQIRNQNLIEKTLSDFGIEIETIKATVGPTITLYEIVPKAGTKISRIQSLEKDIMMSLSALGIRIIAPIPGKGTVGIEVPNKNRQTVSMYSVINSKAFKESKMELPVALGKTITNDVYMFDLAKMPHLLVAGSTGQGKSVGLNAIVTSLLYKKHPSQLKFVMVDPKMVEFSIYGGLEKHYMAQYPGEENIILTDCMKVITTLNSLVEEMEERYKLLMNARCRNIIEYNDKFIHRHLLPTQGHKYLPYIVIIIDEYGDFMMQAGKEIETPIARIAQKARAVGMHLILATQQPSVKIVTSVIKANIPGRIAFRTASNTDSMIILGTPGAEGLVGKGDLLVSYAGNALERVQCAFVDTPEVERIVDFIGNQQGYGQPMQLPEVKEKNQDSGYSGGGDSDKGAGDLDPLFEDAARTIIESGTASTSAIQRKFQVGYNRAGRIMDQLERYKVVGAYNGSKAREIATDSIGLEQILNNLRENGILKGF